MLSRRALTTGIHQTNALKFAHETRPKKVDSSRSFTSNPLHRFTLVMLCLILGTIVIPFLFSSSTNPRRFSPKSLPNLVRVLRENPQHVSRTPTPSASWITTPCGLLPLHRINDNYCDCPVGDTDEPLTSACSPVGQFMCHAPPHQKIPSSHVGDGIHDCMDGSDEI